MASIDSETAQRILTFEDTLAQYFSSTTLQRKVQLSQNEIELVSFTDNVINKETRLSNARITLTRSSALAAAQKSIHKRTAILDFASATMPGGGVLISDFLRENYYERNRRDACLSL